MVPLSLAQVERKFIVVTCDSTLVIFDQHASDERVRLEILTKLVIDMWGKPESEVLLVAGAGVNSPERRGAGSLVCLQARQSDRWLWVRHGGLREQASPALFEFENRAVLDSMELADAQVT